MNQAKLYEIEIGNTFKIADVEFIKFSQDGEIVTAVAKESAFDSTFGKDNNFTTSNVLDKLTKKFLPKIEKEVGTENIFNVHTDLTTLDGLKPYEELTSKISIPTFDFYRQNVELFDKYKLDNWWWLAAPESAQPHSESSWTMCVTPSGRIIHDDCYFHYGVRPLLNFASRIFVSCEE